MRSYSADCRETLRIYPIQPVVMRHLLAPTQFAGYDLPAGAFVGVAATLVHMNPDLYPDPDSELLVTALGEIGVTAELVSWDDPMLPWDAIGIVVGGAQGPRPRETTAITLSQAVIPVR